MSADVAVVDLGIGNIGSVLNMLRKAGASPVATSDASVIREARRIVLPGVGAFGRAVESLDQLGLRDDLTTAVHVNGTPLLAICLGMQLLARSSEEGGGEGLGWIQAECRRLHPTGDSGPLPVPLMGWASVYPTRPHVLLDGADELRFYFLHSYAVVCDEESDILAEADYGGRFTCAVARDNVVGVQFHPEKSHRFGLAVMRRFLTWA